MPEKTTIALVYWVNGLAGAKSHSTVHLCEALWFLL